MARYADCLAVLPNFRSELLRRSGELRRFDRAFTTRGAFSSWLSPTANIHATGVGLRALGDNRYESDLDNVVLKVFVFDEDLAREEDNIPSAFNDIPVDVEHRAIAS